MVVLVILYMSHWRFEAFRRIVVTYIFIHIVFQMCHMLSFWFHWNIPHRWEHYHFLKWIMFLLMISTPCVFEIQLFTNLCWWIIQIAWLISNKVYSCYCCWETTRTILAKNDPRTFSFMFDSYQNHILRLKLHFVHNNHFYSWTLKPCRLFWGNS